MACLDKTKNSIHQTLIEGGHICYNRNMPSLFSLYPVGSIILDYNLNPQKVVGKLTTKAKHTEKSIPLNFLLTQSISGEKGRYNPHNDENDVIVEGVQPEDFNIVTEGTKVYQVQNISKQVENGAEILKLNRYENGFITVNLDGKQVTFDKMATVDMFFEDEDQSSYQYIPEGWENEMKRRFDGTEDEFQGIDLLTKPSGDFLIVINDSGDSSVGLPSTTMYIDREGLSRLLQNKEMNDYFEDTKTRKSYIEPLLTQ